MGLIKQNRPFGITFLSVSSLAAGLYGISLLFNNLSTIYQAFSPGAVGMMKAVGGLSATFTCCLFLIATAYGLWKMVKWGWIYAIIIYGLIVIARVTGTIFVIYQQHHFRVSMRWVIGNVFFIFALVYLLQPKVKKLFESKVVEKFGD
ncbi:MAG TPA: hypothetical protein VHE12_12965 [bacterium]|nr:hypothetical protein [bacterium]